MLIIDDDPMVLESLDMLFTHYGWDVLTAEDGDTVIDALRPIDYQLAVVDQRMDGTNGIDVIRELKLRSSAPVFMLTGCVDPGLRYAAERVGVDRFFDKPVQASEMIRALDSL
ncbi:response regulator [Pelagicoccus sp. NFK12]|uniref:Response regulator n=1 Tax=Pelagicoccus enzymogenes TaxID=2773457 RepID=A0A927FDC5_9BACT|nr:response regulator [Pelagicoccus enzymogenes]MBD5781338.1 response regulator [Pelagicoccus enzymogenes]